jgi:predicted nucleic acid-binding protein
LDNPKYIDVNVFVYWLANHPEHGKIAQQWIKKAEESTKNTYLTSSLTLYETAVIICGLTGKNLKDKDYITQIISPITQIKGLTITPLTQQQYTHAAELMNKYKLDYEDALHLSTAIKAGAQQIISNNKHFDQISQPKRTWK